MVTFFKKSWTLSSQMNASASANAKACLCRWISVLMQMHKHGLSLCKLVCRSAM